MADPEQSPVAVVTGAARRVGRAVALELASAGFDLIITRHRSDREAAAVQDMVRAAGRACEVHSLDLNDAEAVVRFGEHCGRLDRLDVLVHNASSYGRSPIGTITAEQGLGHYRVNALAPLLLTQAAAPALRRSPMPGGAAVVAFSDIHVLGRPRRAYSAYAMSKAALTQMVHCLARDLAPVRVNAIAPGVVAWPDDAEPAEVDRYESRIPLGRPGTPEDAARTVRWLACEAAYVTGEVLRLDGGRWLA